MSIADGFERLFEAAVKFFEALIAVALATLAALLSVLAVMLDMAAAAIRGVTVYAVWFGRGACVLVAVLAAWVSFEPVALAYGGDVVAFIPAVLVVGLPIVWALRQARRSSWGGLLLAGVIVFITGRVLAALPYWVNAALVLAALGMAFFQLLSKRKGVAHVQVR